MATTSGLDDIPPIKSEQSGSVTSAGAYSIGVVGMSDINDAISAGWKDFKALPSHLIFLSTIYPGGAFLLAHLTVGYDLLPLFFPLVAGFALVGPFAAIGLYQISRAREQGRAPAWKDALDVWRSPNRVSILFVGVLLFIIFAAWMFTASWLYHAVMGPAPIVSVGGFLSNVLTTGAGWTLIILGHALGFLFAAAAFAISVVSFPMMLDRDVSADEAISASIATVKANPATMAAWAATIAFGLIAGSALFFVGLVIILPVLAHATWHIYRRAIRWA